MSTDISNLSGSALFDALASGSALTTNPDTMAEAPLLIDPWQTKAIVLLQFQYECENCGSVHLAPNPHLFFRRVHPNIGTHYKALTTVSNLPSDFEDLPRTTETYIQPVSVCQQCFADAPVSALQVQTQVAPVSLEDFTIDNPPNPLGLKVK